MKKKNGPLFVLVVFYFVFKYSHIPILLCLYQICARCSYSTADLLIALGLESLALVSFPDKPVKRREEALSALVLIHIAADWTRISWKTHQMNSEINVALNLEKKGVIISALFKVLADVHMALVLESLALVKVLADVHIALVLENLALVRFPDKPVKRREEALLPMRGVSCRRGGQRLYDHCAEFHIVEVGRKLYYQCTEFHFVKEGRKHVRRLFLFVEVGSKHYDQCAEFQIVEVGRKLSDQCADFHFFEVGRKIDCHCADFHIVQVGRKLSDQDVHGIKC